MTDSIMNIYDDVAVLQEQVALLQSQIAALGAPIALAENTDLNTLGVGNYYIPTSTICGTILNKPVTSNSTAFVEVTPGGADGQKMMYYRICSKDGASYYQRAYYSSGWGSWHEINVYDSGWVDLPMASGITAYSDAQKPRCRRIGKEVMVCGVFKGAVGTDVTIATLPVNFRPAKKHILPIASVGQMIGKISVETDGSIVLNRTTVEPIIAENWHSIACSFCVD